MHRNWWSLATGILVGTWLVGSSWAAPHDFQIGDVICGVMGGNYKVYDNNGVYIETIYDSLGGVTTGASFVEDPTNPPGRLYVTDFNFGKVVVIDGGIGHAVLQIIDTLPPGGWSCESLVHDQSNGFFVGHASGDQDVQRYDSAGIFLGDFDVAIGPAGSDWIELGCDQSTLFYTSEGTAVKRYDLSSSTQLADFATGLPNPSFQLRLLPPFDGTNGLLVAGTASVFRLDGTGAIAQTYDVAGEDFWFSVCLDPNGTSFWAGDLGTADFYRFQIASGAVEIGPINTGTGYGTFAGMTVVGAPSAGSNDPPIFEQAPCTETVHLAAGSPYSYVVSCTDPDPGDSITITATGVPPGATHTPALPLVGAPDQDLTTVFNWTPTVADVGSYTVLYSLTDAGCGATSCTVNLIVDESYLILATAPGTDTFTVGGHLFSTQISALREWYVATPESTPVFDAPPLEIVWFRPGPFGSSGTSGVALLDSFSVQALRYDPVEFPSDPERYSGGLAVRVWNTGLIVAEPYGQSHGLRIALDVFSGTDGKRYYRFPITLEGASR